MELAIDQPGGTAIQVYRCGHCGDLRACRPGWHTCCHVCLDERTDGGLLEENSRGCLAMFAQNPLLALQAGRNLNLGRGEQITPRAVVQATACLTVAAQLARYERPGWTVLATDVWGLPGVGSAAAGSRTEPGRSTTRAARWPCCGRGRLTARLAGRSLGRARTGRARTSRTCCTR